MAARVLIVEDEAPLAALLQYNLEKEGYAVAVAVSGEEALEHLDRLVPDILLLDWMLPKISGLEVCRRLRQRADMADVAVMMLTARTNEGDRVAALNLGADDYLCKPFAIRELVARLRAVLKRTRPHTRSSEVSSRRRVVD
jgi:two-component system phosphate regulon response regulator PhoB